MKKTLIIIAIVIVVVLGIIFTIRFMFGGDEDTWICQNSQWIRHGNPNYPQPTSGCGINNK